MVSTMQEHDAATKLKSAIVTILYRASYSGWREKWREVLQLWRSWPFGGSPTRLQTLTDTDQSRDCPQPRASGGDCFYSGESGHMVCRIMPPTTDRPSSRENALDPEPAAVAAVLATIVDRRGIWRVGPLIAQRLAHLVVSLQSRDCQEQRQDGHTARGGGGGRDAWGASENQLHPQWGAPAENRWDTDGNCPPLPPAIS